MNFKIIQPPQQLADYVRYFWFLEGNQSFVHHAFAYSCPEIIFCYKGQFSYSFEFETAKTMTSGIYGQTQTFSKVALKDDFGIFGFYLYPQALPQLFCLPANELTNHSVDIKTLCGKAGEMLEEKIMLASNNDQRVKIVCAFLQARLKNVNTEYAKKFSSINAILNSSRPMSVKALADNSFLSIRQFERRFKEFSGFSPKLFSRIIRFNSLLNKTFEHRSLTQVALEHGYYDQSHFIHDFKIFSGYNPKAYFKQETMAASDRGTIEFNT